MQTDNTKQNGKSKTETERVHWKFKIKTNASTQTHKYTERESESEKRRMPAKLFICILNVVICQDLQVVNLPYIIRIFCAYPTMRITIDPTSRADIHYEQRIISRWKRTKNIKIYRAEDMNESRLNAKKKKKKKTHRMNNIICIKMGGGERMKEKW